VTTFTTGFRYSDRESKAEYVWRKYGEILSAEVLDVGADQCFLKPYVVANRGSYRGVGFGPSVDLEVDLETGTLPFPDGSFDAVICLDTLEHLEAAHAVFGELCRVAREHVLISLPNCWNEVWHALRTGDYAPGQPLKFYGLPERPPQDRHRWFFSLGEARSFLRHNAARNGFVIAHMDTHAGVDLFGPGVRGLVKRLLLRQVFRSDLERLELTEGTLWALLRRNPPS
jgi:hypothetical protein